LGEDPPALPASSGMDTGQKRVIRPPQPSTKASDGLKTSNQQPLTTPATAERWRQLPDLGLICFKRARIPCFAVLV